MKHAKWFQDTFPHKIFERTLVQARDGIAEQRHASVRVDEPDTRRTDGAHAGHDIMQCARRSDATDEVPHERVAELEPAP